MPVYMLQAGAFGDVKIGVATEPLARMRQLQTSMPKKLRLVRVLDGGLAEEKALHQRFAAHRLTGEWFRPTPAILTDDVGLSDLPIPTAKRDRRPDLTSARGRWASLREDLLELIGGSDALARALAIPPWLINGWVLHQEHLSALIVLARQAGAPVTFGQARKIQRAATAEYRRDVKDGQRQNRRDIEAKWLEKNGGIEKAWWPIDPLNAKPPDPDLDMEPA